MSERTEQSIEELREQIAFERKLCREGVDSPPLGKATTRAAFEAELASNPQDLSAELDKPEYRQAFLTAFLRRLQRGERDAVRLYAECKRIVGEKGDLAALVLVNIGASSQDEARQLISLAKSAAGESPETLTLRAAEYIGQQLRSHPDLSGEVFRRIGMLPQQLPSTE